MHRQVEVGGWEEEKRIKKGRWISVMPDEYIVRDAGKRNEVWRESGVGEDHGNCEEVLSTHPSPLVVAALRV